MTQTSGTAEVRRQRLRPEPVDDLDLIAQVKNKALFAREETVRLTGIAKTGHYASAFSCAEILAALYYGGIMRLRRGEPRWEGRDRFLFGKGHAAIAQYPFLADHGFFDTSVLDEYTRLGNPLGDHPDMTKVPGVDFSSGSLGHALSAGLGMALAGRLNNLDYNVFVLLGDGEQHEGQIWEASLSAAHHRTGNLIAIVDRNEYSLDGKVDDIIGIEPVLDKWEAFGWNTIDIDGHDVPQVIGALREATSRSHDGIPTVIVAHTIKGKGIPYMETQFGWHLGYLAPSDQERALAHLRSNA